MKTGRIIFISLAVLLLFGIGFFFNTKVLSIGSIDSKNVVNIFTDFPIKIENIFVEPGALVKKGEKLLRIDEYEYNKYISSIKVKIADFNLELKKLNYQKQKLQNEVSLLAQEIETIKNKIDSKTRLKEQFSLSDIDDLKIELSRKVSTKMQLQIDLDSYLDQSRYVALQGKINQLKIDLDYATDSFSKPIWNKSDLVFPLARGLVTEIFGKEGEKVDSNFKILTIKDLDHLTVKALVKYEELKYMREGKKVKVIYSTDFSLFQTAGKDYDFGTIVKLSNVAAEAANSGSGLEPNFVALEVEILYIENVTLPNMSVRLEINKYEFLD